MAYILYDLMDSLLGANVTARQAYELIVPVLVDTGLADVCEPLIEFLTIARYPECTAQPASGGGEKAGRADAASALPCRDPGPQVSNTNRAARFLANTPFSRNVRSRSVTAAIAVAGPPPNVTRGGVSMCMCVSWHGKGMCVEPCERAADHGNLTVEETTAFRA
jgi:hypothetical protein